MRENYVPLSLREKLIYLLISECKSVFLSLEVKIVFLLLSE